MNPGCVRGSQCRWILLPRVPHPPPLPASTVHLCNVLFESKINRHSVLLCHLPHQLCSRNTGLLQRGRTPTARSELKSELPWLGAREGRGPWGRVGGRGARAGTVLSRWLGDLLCRFWGEHGPADTLTAELLASKTLMTRFCRFKPSHVRLCAIP